MKGYCRAVGDMSEFNDNPAYNLVLPTEPNGSEYQSAYFRNHHAFLVSLVIKSERQVGMCACIRWDRV
jgi:hypothetical protein